MNFQGNRNPETLARSIRELINTKPVKGPQDNPGDRNTAVNPNPTSTLPLENCRIPMDYANGMGLGKDHSFDGGATPGYESKDRSYRDHETE